MGRVASGLKKFNRRKYVAQDRQYHPRNVYLIVQLYTNLSMSESDHLGKCSHHIFLNILGYKHFLGDPTTPSAPTTIHPKIYWVATPQPQGLTPMCACCNQTTDRVSDLVRHDE